MATIKIPDSVADWIKFLTGKKTRIGEEVRVILLQWEQWSRARYANSEATEREDPYIRHAPVQPRQRSRTYPYPNRRKYVLIRGLTNCNGCDAPLAINPEWVMQDICKWQPSGVERKHYFGLGCCVILRSGSAFEIKHNNGRLYDGA